MIRIWFFIEWYLKLGSGVGNGRNVYCGYVLFFMGMFYFLIGVIIVNEYLE